MIVRSHPAKRIAGLSCRSWPVFQDGPKIKLKFRPVAREVHPDRCGVLKSGHSGDLRSR